MDGERRRVGPAILAHRSLMRLWVSLFHILVFEFLVSRAAEDSTASPPEAIPDCNLQDAIPKEKRKNVYNGLQEMKLGIVKVGWASAEIQGRMLLIIAEEVIGLNAHFSDYQSGSVGIVMTLDDPKNHIGVEAWTTLYQAQIDKFIAEAGSNAPQAVGKADFVGFEGTHGRRAVFEEANLANPKMFLDYYKGYNRSVFDSFKYFARLSDIPENRMSQCTESRLSNSIEAQLHSQYTGDLDGVETVTSADGEALMLKCLGGPTGYWWAAPACRQNPETCIPWVTGASYGLSFCTQQAAAYNIPIACGNAASWSEYTKIPKEYATLFYWWTPDATFVGVGVKILFPPNNKAEWATSKKTTASADVDLDTWVNANMSKISAQMLYVSEKMALTQKQIDSLLTATSNEVNDMAPGTILTRQQAACMWLKQNSAIWKDQNEGWIQDQTACVPGEGLRDIDSNFVETRAAASSCDWCPRGHKSVELVDDSGRTYICEPCDAGSAQFFQGMTECQECEGGKHANSLGQVECDNCLPGTYAETGQAECANCAKGTSAVEAGTSECTHCQKGRYQDEEKQMICKHCEIGTYAEETRMTACTGCGDKYTTEAIASRTSEACVCDIGAYRLADSALCERCPAGSVTSTIGSSSKSACKCPEGQYLSLSDSADQCVLCPRNSTTDGQGKTSERDCQCERDFFMSSDYKTCLACPTGSTTTGTGKVSVASCHCFKGEFMPISYDGGCKECPKGMFCPAGSNEANARFLRLTAPNEDQAFLELAPRYWASVDDPMSVFECRSEDHCPGGLPGKACAGNLLQQSCEHCATAFHWDGDKCAPCSDVEATKAIYPTIPILCIPVILLFMYKVSRDRFQKWGTWRNGIAVVGFITLSHYQVISIISGASIPIPNTIRGSYNIFLLTNDLSFAFNVECASMTDFRMSVISKGLAPIVVAIWAGIIFGLSRLLHIATKVDIIRLDGCIVLNVLGSIMFTFFSGIAALSLNLFKCNINPNGKKTLNSDFSITCYESDEWNDMLIVAIIFVLIYIFGMGGLFARAILIAPKHFSDLSFQMRYKFLFLKFHSETYWWGLVILAKMFFINLSLCVASSGPAQLYLVMSVAIIYLVGVFMFLPFRHRMANVIEVLSSIFLVVACSLLQKFAEIDEDTRDSMEVTAAIVCFLPILGGGFVALSLIRYGLCVPNKASLASAELDGLYEASKTVQRIVDTSTELGVEMMLQLSEWDNYYLKHATKVIEHEIIGNESKFRLVDKQLSNSLSRVSLEVRDGSTDGNPSPQSAELLVVQAVQVQTANVEKDGIEIDQKPKAPLATPETKVEDPPFNIEVNGDKFRPSLEMIVSDVWWEESKPIRQTPGGRIVRGSRPSLAMGASW